MGIRDVFAAVTLTVAAVGAWSACMYSLCREKLDHSWSLFFVFSGAGLGILCSAVWAASELL